MSAMLLRAIFLTVLALSVLGGCRHRSDSTSGTTAVATSPDVPAVNARRTRRLLQIASRDLSCPEASLSHEQVTERIYRVRGCNDWRDYAIFGRARRGPARWRRILPIGERAVADFGCTLPEITFSPTSPTTYTAVGCGKAAGYELSCNATDCGWVGSAPPAGTYSASVVIIVPAEGVALSADVDGEADDTGEE